MSRRQLNGRLRHSLALGDGLLRQQSAQRLSHEVTECRATPHGRDLGSLHELIGQVESATHKYAYMLSCRKTQSPRAGKSEALTRIVTGGADGTRTRDPRRDRPVF